MTRRHQQHANHDDNQLALDFAWDTRGALSDRRCTSCPRQGSDEGHDNRNQQVTSRRADGHEEQRDTQTAACGAGVAAETIRRPTRASPTRNGKLATALPGRRSPLGSQSGGHAVDPALGGAHHSRRTPTTPLMPLPRAPGGGPDRGPSGDGAPPKRRISVKSSAEYVAEIVDAAPPLTDTQRSRLGALLKPTVVA